MEEDPVMETEAARRRPLDDDGAGDGAEALPPMTTGRHSTRFAGSAVVPSGPQSSPARQQRASPLYFADFVSHRSYPAAHGQRATVGEHAAREAAKCGCVATGARPRTLRRLARQRRVHC